jgi:chemotaxis methyl-accepting protein methylase
LDPAALPSLLEGVIKTESGFFRHSGALNALARQVLPQLYSRRSADPAPIRMWSAGCGTGEETYSIAIAVCDAVNPANVSTPMVGAGPSGGKSKSLGRSGGPAEVLPNSPASPAKLNPSCAVHIVGSDLLPQSIACADRGMYPQSAIDGLPPAIIRNYFSKIGSPAGASNPANGKLPQDIRQISEDGETAGEVRSTPAASAHLLVKPRLRSLVTFNCMNLARPGYIGRFDCIFCMDVLPHFSRAQRLATLERLHLYLEPGGYLFLSQTEKLSAPNLNFRSETFDGYTFHRKPMAASAAYGR